MYLVVCVLMRITLHGGPEKWQKWGRAKRVLSIFCRVKERSCSFWNSTFKFQLFQEIFFSILPCLFTVHIRPVLSPCQAGNTCYTFDMFSNIFTINSMINTIVHSYDILYNISTVIYIGDHRILLDQ